MEALEDSHARWVSMVMERVQELETTQQKQQQTIQDLQEQHRDQLRIFPKNPLPILAGAIRQLLGRPCDSDLQVVYLPTDENGVGLEGARVLALAQCSFAENALLQQEFVAFTGRRVLQIAQVPGTWTQIEIVQLDQGPNGECRLDTLPGLYTAEDFDNRGLMSRMDGCTGWKMARIFSTACCADPMVEWLAAGVTDGMIVDPSEYATSGSNTASDGEIDSDATSSDAS